MEYSACIEMLFANEADNYPDRIKLAKKAGFKTVEFWGWLNKDIDAIKQALTAHEVNLSGLICEPMLSLTDPQNHDAYLDAVKNSVKTAQKLGATILIAQAGNFDTSRSAHAQRASIVAILKDAAKLLKGTGVKLALEPLNTRFDHQGYFLPSTVEALDIIDEVNSPTIGILYDLYHSMVMDEHPATVLNGRVDRVLHVHIADHPGRNEIGSGNLDLKNPLNWLFENGYTGLVGFEFRPTGSTIDALKQTFERLS